jgi:hypothetical protein
MLHLQTEVEEDGDENMMEDVYLELQEAVRNVVLAAKTCDKKVAAMYSYLEGKMSGRSG